KVIAAVSRFNIFTIASQAEIDKYRLQLEFDHGNKYPLRLVHDQKETTDGSL
ncbi:MAG: hypothetical protein JRI63_13205, partial [Deltaproteobacteria bacterium]|nr:hypothetical protein [Deltaproteobacteria bacterium]